MFRGYHLAVAQVRSGDVATGKTVLYGVLYVPAVGARCEPIARRRRVVLDRALDSAQRRALHRVRDRFEPEVAGRTYSRERRAHALFYQLACVAMTPLFQSDSRFLAILCDATFSPMSRIGYTRKEMLRTLAGLKTGPASGAALSVLRS